MRIVVPAVAPTRRKRVRAVAIAASQLAQARASRWRPVDADVAVRPDVDEEHRVGTTIGQAGSRPVSAGGRGMQGTVRRRGAHQALCRFPHPRRRQPARPACAVGGTMWNMCSIDCIDMHTGGKPMRSSGLPRSACPRRSIATPRGTTPKVRARAARPPNCVTPTPAACKLASTEPGPTPLSAPAPEATESVRCAPFVFRLPSPPRVRA